MAGISLARLYLQLLFDWNCLLGECKFRLSGESELLGKSGFLDALDFLDTFALVGTSDDTSEVALDMFEVALDKFEIALDSFEESLDKFQNVVDKSEDGFLLCLLFGFRLDLYSVPELL